MNCFLCSVWIDDDDIGNDLDLYRIFEHFKVESESEKFKLSYFTCNNCRVLVDSLTSTLEKFDEICYEKEVQLEKFKTITKVTNTEEWRERLKREKDQRDDEIASYEAERANRELKRKGLNSNSKRMQPKLVLRKLDANLTRQDHARNKIEYENFNCYSTVFICGYCKPPRNLRFYTCKQELVRHKFGWHPAEMFQEIKPEDWDSKYLEQRLISFVDTKLKSLKSPSLNGKRENYLCDYCYTSHPLLDKDKMYFHLVEMHRWDFTQYLKKCADTYVNEMRGIITPYYVFYYDDPKSYPVAWWQSTPHQNRKTICNSQTKIIMKEKVKVSTTKPKKRVSGNRQTKKTKLLTQTNKLLPQKIKRAVKKAKSHLVGNTNINIRPSSETNLCAIRASVDDIKIEFSSAETETFLYQEPPNFIIKEELAETLFEETAVFPALTNPSKVEANFN